MGLYDEWLHTNLKNKNKKSYKKYIGEDIYIEGIYDTVTRKGVEKRYELFGELPVDLTDEIDDDTHKYME